MYIALASVYISDAASPVQAYRAARGVRKRYLFIVFLIHSLNNATMKIYTKIACCMVWCVLLLSSANAQQKRTSAEDVLLRAQYGDSYEEVLEKYGDDPAKLLGIQQSILAGDHFPTAADAMRSLTPSDLSDIGREEAEPNNTFETADDIMDVLALPGRTSEYNGKLIQGSLSPGDVDVYKFTVDTTKMYYFASTHSFNSAGEDAMNVSMRLYHESDLDTTLVPSFLGIEGNEQEVGSILGRNTDYRANSGDFRLTGWSAPIDADTGEKLTGDFYLWITNREGVEGTYFMAAYQIDFEPWVSRAEPNYPFQNALLNPDAVLPVDGVVRTYMAFAPDTVKVVTPDVPTQSNSAFPLLLAQGDEDVDLFLVDYKAGHTLTVETLPYFGWYRESDGTIGPGNTRFTDPRIRIYDADFTEILAEDDDGARERMDGPNNIHSRLVLDSDFFAEKGITQDTPLWFWVSAWASSTRTITDPNDGNVRSVDNRDPGRFMYDVYATLVNEEGVEMEPNNTTDEATSATAGSQAVYTGSFADGSDVDYFRVFMHELRMYTLFTANSTVSSDIEIEIFREEEIDSEGALQLTGNLLTGSVAGNAGNNDFILSGFVPEATGAYLVKLSSASAGDYELGLIDKGEVYFGRVANEPDDIAADALAQEAMEVGPGAQSETAMIFPAGDIDHYYFTVADGFELALSLGGTTAELVDDFDVQMTLFTDAFDEVATGTDAISQTLSAGTYVVQVAPVNDDEVGFYTLSGGVPFEESEPNETFADANAIALGQIYNAELTSGDTDFYQFTLEAGKLYSFRSLDNNTGGELSVGFYDEVNGPTLLDDSGWPDNYGGANFKIANIIPRETGTYYLSVAGGAGDYKLTSRVNPDYLALQGKGEPNNNMAEADAQGAYQALGADVMFALADQNHPRFFGDEDWFRVELAAGQSITAETKPVGGDLWTRDTDTRIVIFAADGTTELANDDDGGNDWYSRAGYVASGNETVYVVVRTSRTPEEADDRSLNRGDYLLNIDVKVGEAEPNNTFAEANNLVTGFIEATYSAEDSVDVYALSLQEDFIYHVRTVRDGDGAYEGPFSAKLFKESDTSTNLLDEENTGYNNRYSGDNVKLNIIPDETGTYFLELTGAPEDGVYLVGIKGRDISELKDLGEPNNTVEEADAFGIQEFNAPGDVSTYMLYNAGFPFSEGDPISTRFGDDVDIYKYELVPGDTLIAETSPVDGPLWPRDYDGFMELLDESGTIIADNDDGGFDWHSRIEFVAETAGSYYVQVRSQDFGEATDRDPSRGEYNLSVTKQDGSPIVITDVEDSETPHAFELEQNYPNPFNPATTIAYSIPEAADVELAVYNILGQRVATLVSSFQSAGSYNVNFDASQLASGLYLYRIEAGTHVSVKKMLLVK